MRTKAELAELAKANASATGEEEKLNGSQSFLTEHQRAALDAALAAKQTSPGKHQSCQCCDVVCNAVTSCAML